MLAPISASGTDYGPDQPAALSVQSSAHQGVSDASKAAAGTESPRAEVAALRTAEAERAEAAKIRAKQEAARAKAKEEAARVQAQQEAVRVQAEQEAARVQAEEAARVQAEEAARVQAEQEAARVQAEQEAARAAEEAARVQAEADAAAAAAGRVINVGYAGGQDVVDMGVGPVLFPLPGNWPPYVAEHDFYGGWDRIGTLAPGMTVTMTGLVSGTYTVGEIINVPRGGRTSDLVFSVMPKVMLQTCIPGTSLMVVVGLY